MEPLTTEPNHVLPYLRIGAYRDALNESYLKSEHIDFILNVKDSCRYPSTPDVRYLHVPLSDYGDQNLFDENGFETCFTFIESAKEANGVCLVHCSQGVNRAPTIVLGYLVAKLKWTLKRAYEHLMQVRPMLSPHEKYFEQLQQLEQQVHGSISLTRHDIGPSLQETLRQLRTEGAPRTARSPDETSIDRASTATNFSVSTLGNETIASQQPTVVSTDDRAAIRNKAKCRIA